MHNEAGPAYARSIAGPHAACPVKHAQHGMQWPWAGWILGPPKQHPVAPLNCRKALSCATDMCCTSSLVGGVSGSTLRGSKQPSGKRSSQPCPCRIHTRMLAMLVHEVFRRHVQHSAGAAAAAQHTGCGHAGCITKQQCWQASLEQPGAQVSQLLEAAAVAHPSVPARSSDQGDRTKAKGCLPAVKEHPAGQAPVPHADARARTMAAVRG